MSVATLPPRSTQSSEQPPEEVWPEWLVPPERGYFAEDLDRLPGLPPHTELLNGSLVFVSPQTSWHDCVIFAIRTALKAQLPEDWRVRSNLTVKLGPRDRPEPDVLVITADVLKARTTWVPPEAVRLVVEVVSPESEVRDREVKYRKYAQAGIKHYWRVEPDTEDPSVPVVNHYTLDETGEYRAVGVQRGRVMARLPFVVDIDLTDLD